MAADTQQRQGILHFGDGVRYDGAIRSCRSPPANAEVWKEKGAGHTAVAHGRGTLYDRDGRVAYTGEWRNGVRHGVGEGQVEADSLVCVYSGEWVHGQMHGEGRLLPQDGDPHESKGQGFLLEEGSTYEGDFENGLPTGYGVLVHANHDKYEGEFKDGMRSGWGTETFSFGGKYTGRWERNQRHGCGTFIWPSGRVEEREYAKGILVRATEAREAVEDRVSALVEEKLHTEMLTAVERLRDMLKDPAAKLSKAQHRDVILLLLANALTTAEDEEEVEAEVEAEAEAEGTKGHS